MSVPTVTLGYPACVLTLGRILEWDETKTSKMPVKHPIAADEETQPDYHVVYPTIIELRCRLTTTQKNLLYVLEAQTAWQPLTENGTTRCVWIEDIDIEYQGDDHYDAPWYARITLLHDENIVWETLVGHPRPCCNDTSPP